ncbi:MAG TPA: sensor histidine kinase [Bacillota bacterium]|nr:sensor histidine kinase [Bacillota bacterium]HOO31288.1 sensor histidine kinase [Bacillota bacterium]HPQ02212.1 sensor histidine kinase [Bacillota bacterium]
MKLGRFLLLQDRVFLFAIVVIVFAIATAGAVSIWTMKSELENRSAECAVSIARTFALATPVRENLGKPGGASVIQPMAEAVSCASGAQFVVTIDMEGIRYSHPIPDRIGKHVAGGDEDRSLAGEEYVSRACGTMGPSMRAFVPIYDPSGKQAGAAVVGYLVDDMSREVRATLKKMYAALFVSLVVGMIGSCVLAQNVKKAMFGMEPFEIASLLEQQDAILSSVREGIIAVNADAKITLVNDEAKRMLSIEEDIVGMPVAEAIPTTRLPEVLATGKPEYDREQVLGRTLIVTNRVPVVVNGKAIGAVASFRDNVEVKKLAEELTGVRKYVEALRIQSHEFKNTLHAVAGMIQMGRYDDALDCIIQVSESRDKLVNFASSRIRVVPLAALLISKAGAAREQGVDFCISPDSRLDEVPTCIDVHDLVTVVGNLLDNAMEAAACDPGSGAGRRQVRVTLRQAEDGTHIEVANTGPAIPDDVAQRMWDHGFTTKSDGHGIGLALVKDRVEAARGRIWFERVQLEHDSGIDKEYMKTTSGETSSETEPPVEGGTVFYVFLPVEDGHEQS